MGGCPCLSSIYAERKEEMRSYLKATVGVVLIVCAFIVCQRGSSATGQTSPDGTRVADEQTPEGATFEGKTATEWFTAVSDRTEEYGHARLALVVMGESALSAICSAMDHENARVRHEAATIFMRLADIGISDEASIGKLKAGVRDSDALVRMCAVQALSRLEAWTVEDVPMLIEFLQNKSEHDATLWSGYGALGSLGQESPQAVVPALIRVLNEGTLRDKRHTAVALGIIGPKAALAIPDLVETLKDVKEPASKSTWISMNSSAYVAADTAEALGKIGILAKDALPVLEELKSEGPTWVRARAHYAIAKITGQPRPHVEAMIRTLQSDVPDRHYAAEFLGELCAEPDLAVPALITALEERSTARVYAIRALARFGGSAKAAVPALIELLDVQHMELPLDVAIALGSISGERHVVEALKAHLKGQNFFTRYGCLEALARLAPQSHEAREAVEAATRSEDKDLRLEALLKLKKHQVHKNKISNRNR